MLNDLKLKTRLIFTFLLLSVIPFVLISAIIQIFSSQLQKSTRNALISVRNIKQTQLLDYFESIKQQTLNFSESKLMAESLPVFHAAFLQLAETPEKARLMAQSRYFSGSEERLRQKSEGRYGGPYEVAHAGFHPGFSSFVHKSDFSDLFLVNLDGDVIYSVKKEKNFGTNLLKGPFATAHLASAFKKITRQIETDGLSRDSIVFIDFQLDPAGQKVVAFLARPVIQFDFVIGYVVFQLSTDKIIAIMSEREGLGKTGETYLVGQDNLIRSNLLRPPTAQTLEAAFHDPEANRIKTLSVAKALNGEKGFQITASYRQDRVLSAYIPVRIFDVTWAFVAELTEKEAHAGLSSLRNGIIGVAIATIIVVAIMALFLSNSISGPLIDLTRVTEVISTGNLEQTIRYTDRKDELGRLSKSFAQMRDSIREKLELIQKQNQELESKIELIKKQNEELKKADQLKDEFLANTSHELRTPIHGIMGIAESMLDGAAGTLSDQQKTNLSMIFSGSKRLSGLINDLLDFHKIRHQALKLELEQVDLKTTATLVLDLSRPLTKGKNLQLINQIPDALPMIPADPERLEQILYNLIGNAIKYTPEGQVSLDAAEKNGYLEITVSDTGIGISPEQQERIFEPLVQGDGTVSREQGGTGLGLSISRQLVELHGGTLRVESRPGIGSKFFFTLPLAKDAALKPVAAERAQKTRSDSYSLLDSPRTAPALEPHAPESPQSSDKVKTILAVDDDPVNLQVLDNLLSLKHYRIVPVQDGFQALAFLEKEAPDLILLDVMMPRLSGYEVCRKIRETHDLITLPIIMLTARNQQKDLLEGFAAGANDYLIKPFHKEELYARVNTLLSAKESVERLKENEELKQEIQRRKLAEAELLASRQRLLKILDTAEDAIVCLNESEQILFFNQRSVHLFGYAKEELLGKQAEIIFPESIQKIYLSEYNALDPDAITSTRNEIKTAIRRKNGETATYHAFISILRFEEELVYAVILHDLDPAQNDRARLLNEIEKSKNRIEALENALNSVNKLFSEKHWVLAPESSSLESKDLPESWSHTEEDRKLRKALVDVMTKVLNYWEITTEESKIELAEKSRIWRVYLDRGTWQTRTLDKYLNLHTLPRNPRWRDVVRTAQYVLNHCPLKAQQCRELEEVLAKLEEIMKNRKMA
jgi:two-component system sensor histidine kinase ChiS